MSKSNAKLGVALMLGVILGAWLFGQSNLATRPATAAPAPGATPPLDMAALQARVAMIAVDYHASNLWFAGRAENWPLADYYWKQTLNHIRYSSDVKGTPGNQAQLADLATQLESAPNAQIGAAIERKDLRLFLSSYRTLLEGCYACHKAAGLPFLRPRIPAPPASAIITIDANAPWPQ
ncbi:MAG: hypothetical protein AB7O59_07130 [Pirellulales bacterium]